LANFFFSILSLAIFKALALARALAFCRFCSLVMVPEAAADSAKVAFAAFALALAIPAVDYPSVGAAAALAGA
jgi:hypothetical protein